MTVRAPIFPMRILTMSPILAPWLPCPAMWRARAPKRAYRAAFEGMIDVLGQSHAHGRDRSRALAIAALWLRGMVIARASDDRRLADELRQAAMEVALELGGWEKSQHGMR